MAARASFSRSPSPVSPMGAFPQDALTAFQSMDTLTRLPSREAPDLQPLWQALDILNVLMTHADFRESLKQKGFMRISASMKEVKAFETSVQNLKNPADDMLKVCQKASRDVLWSALSHRLNDTFDELGQKLQTHQPAQSHQEAWFLARSTYQKNPLVLRVLHDWLDMCAWVVAHEATSGMKADSIAKIVAPSLFGYQHLEMLDTDIKKLAAFIEKYIEPQVQHYATRGHHPRRRGCVFYESADVYTAPGATEHAVPGNGVPYGPSSSAWL